MMEKDEERNSFSATRDSFELDDLDENAAFLPSDHTAPATAYQAPSHPGHDLTPRGTGRKLSSFSIRFCLLQGILIVIYTTITVAYIALSRQSDRLHGLRENIPRHPALPEVQAVTWRMDEFGYTLTSDFTGKPGFGNKEAWEDILKELYLNVSVAEFKGAASWDLPDIIPPPGRNTISLEDNWTSKVFENNDEDEAEAMAQLAAGEREHGGRARAPVHVGAKAKRFPGSTGNKYGDSLKSDLKAIVHMGGLTGLRREGGQGRVMVSLGAFHELACVKTLWEANWRDDLHPDASAEEKDLMRADADQCVEKLRQAAMCRPDLETLSGWRWNEHKGHEGELEFSPSEQRGRCVDWDIIQDRLADRIVDETKIKELSEAAKAKATEEPKSDESKETEEVVETE